MKLTLKQQYMLSVLYFQYHACWCTGDFRSQCISRHGIDLWNIPSPASEELIIYPFLPLQSSSLSLSAQEQQLQQLQLLQQQLVQQSQLLRTPAAAVQAPLIDSNLLAQIQALTNQLLKKTQEEVKPPEPAFNKVCIMWDRMLLLELPVRFCKISAASLNDMLMALRKAAMELPQSLNKPFSLLVFLIWAQFWLW